MTQAMPPGRDMIRYDLLVQNALKGVVRKVLVDAGKDGLPGDHHFYISFRTDFAGVRLSQRMREKYPDEMTIVLQHQFWDLGVTEHAFEVGLSFSGVPERLLIPFDAIVGFFDPSVQFGLKFELNGDAVEATSAPAAAPKPQIRSVPADGEGQDETPAKPAARRPPPAALPAPRGAASEPAETKPTKSAPASTGKHKQDAAAGTPTADDEAPAEGAARVVSLDAFRKKT